ncbi:hypothetical protein RchiOBHm_Chr2g0142421 [Rosa chinensis]|uniref:Uncharacterized protein n=1 Tax=Rosa chinensis TaxID=74649 RepID=A0A2P6RXV3_ROSCH|nr:hypothetical protein RchiOBHm_Chr2g0142421 [Rosa chinensis]
MQKFVQQIVKVLLSDHGTWLQSAAKFHSNQTYVGIGGNFPSPCLSKFLPVYIHTTDS